MKHIYELHNMGIDKQCLIVGNGEGAKKIKLDKLKDFYIIRLNKITHEDIADMVIYYDEDIKRYYDSTLIKSDVKVIGYKDKHDKHLSDRCNYYYSWSDMVFGDSGFHALQFADKIFNFSKIYVVGFDYMIKDVSEYLKSKDVDKDNCIKFLNWSIKVVQEYYKMDWNNKIFNCDSHSALMAFDYINLN